MYLVQEWVALRVRDRQAAEEVVQRVFLRLASELAEGKVYRVPYRVVVWNVVNWTARGYEWSAKEGATLPDEWDAAAPDEFEEWEGEHDLGILDRRPARREREVLDLLYREGLSPAQVAERLGIEAERSGPGDAPRAPKGGGEACMRRAVDELFAEYAAAYGRGERPRAGDYLDARRRRRRTSSRR